MLTTLAGAVAVSAIIACAPFAARAQGQVYDPLPPPGSAYVRFVNALEGDVEARPEFLPVQRLGATPIDRVTPYFVVEKVAGRNLVADMRGGNRAGHATFHAEAGSFVTLILRPGAAGNIDAVPVIDQADFNQTRARLSFYNATPACPAAALALADGGAAVFQGVAPGVAKARSVNPIETGVVASCGELTAPALALRGIEAGGMYSVWLMQPAALTAFLTRDVTARWKP